MMMEMRVDKITIPNKYTRTPPKNQRWKIMQCII